MGTVSNHKVSTDKEVTEISATASEEGENWGSYLCTRGTKLPKAKKSKFFHDILYLTEQTYGKITPETKKESYFFGTAPSHTLRTEKGAHPNGCTPLKKKKVVISTTNLSLTLNLIP